LQRAVIALEAAGFDREDISNLLCVSEDSVRKIKNRFIKKKEKEMIAYYKDLDSIRGSKKKVEVKKVGFWKRLTCIFLSLFFRRDT
jgi:transposase